MCDLLWQTVLHRKMDSIKKGCNSCPGYSGKWCHKKSSSVTIILCISTKPNTMVVTILSAAIQGKFRFLSAIIGRINLLAQVIHSSADLHYWQCRSAEE